MPALQQQVMNTLYGRDVWQGFAPREVTEGVQGWNGHHPSLGALAATPGEKIVVDVGVWKGQSTITMAAAMRDAGIDGVVIAVDTFLGSPEHWAMPELYGRDHGLPDLYWTFLSNVSAAGVQDYVVPMPQTSVTAAAVLRMRGVAPSLVHVDAAHEYEEALRDAEEYWSLLTPGGWLIGDDYHVTWPGVVKAAGAFSASTGVPLEIVANKWIMRKPG